MKALLDLLRGFRGHPSHPPLTDLSIGAYSAGTIAFVIGGLGFAEEKMAWAGFVAIAVGLVSALPTVLTGFLDYIQIPRGTGMRRTANIHWVLMVLATSVYVVTEAFAQKAFDTGQLEPITVILSVVAFLLLGGGGWMGGTIVYVYGMRVHNEDPDHPASEAAKPKPYRT